MPDRIMRAKILTSEKVDRLEAPAEVFYRRLINVVDDFGRFDARPSILRSACYPLRTDKFREADILRSLAACQSAELIALYEVEGKPYLELLNLQDRRRAKHSKYPPPPSDNICQHVSADVVRRQQMRPESDSDAHSDSDADSKPPDPQGGGVKMPQSLDCDDFRKAWDRWKTHLRQKRVKTTTLADEQQIAKCVKWGVEWSIANIDHSIAGSYQGLYPDKSWSSKNGHRKTARDSQFPEPETVLPERRARARGESFSVGGAAGETKLPAAGV